MKMLNFITFVLLAFIVIVCGAKTPRAEMLGVWGYDLLRDVEVLESVLRATDPSLVEALLIVDNLCLSKFPGNFVISRSVVTGHDVPLVYDKNSGLDCGDLTYQQARSVAEKYLQSLDERAKEIRANISMMMAAFALVISFLGLLISYRTNISSRSADDVNSN